MKNVSGDITFPCFLLAEFNGCSLSQSHRGKKKNKKKPFAAAIDNCLFPRRVQPKNTLPPRQGSQHHHVAEET